MSTPLEERVDTLATTAADLNARLDAMLAEAVVAASAGWEEA